MPALSRPRMHEHVGAIATAVVLMLLIPLSAVAGRGDLSGLASAEQHDQFIVNPRAPRAA